MNISEVREEAKINKRLDQDLLHGLYMLHLCNMSTQLLSRHFSEMVKNTKIDKLLDVYVASPQYLSQASLNALF